MRIRHLLTGLLLAHLTLGAPLAHAARIGDICEIQGARPNMLKGVGLVVGLAATGDSAKAAIMAQERMLRRMGIDVESIGELASANVAMVSVTTTLPAYAKAGTRLDVKVDSLFDAKSLEGGTLLETYLKGPGQGDTVYAVAQGSVSVGGFNADASGGTSVRKNHVASGRIPMGALVEHEVPSIITDGQRLTLLLKTPNFGTAAGIQDVLNRMLGENAALAMGAGTVRVTIPEEDRGNLVGFITRLQDIRVETRQPTRVVLNERTGTIVVGGDVVIKPCYVAQGNLTIKIAVTPEAVPPLPLTFADTTVINKEEVSTEEVEAVLMPVQGTSAGDVAQALNKLRVTPRDMISIFQALHKGGYLEADLEIM